jgi:thioredoxin reductase (NADPH)
MIYKINVNRRLGGVRMADVIIIGSGPAGISAALYTARAGLDTTIISMGKSALDKAEAIQNFYGFAQPITGQELAACGVEGAKNVGAKIIDEEVVGISYNGELVVETSKENYTAKYVLLATGSPRATPRIQGIKEFEGKGVSYCAVCDAFFYRGKNVCVLGNGEYAAHEIEALLPVAASITLLTNGIENHTELPENVKVNTAKVVAIEGIDHVEKVKLDDGSEIEANGVFVAYGVAGSTALARKIGAQIKDNKILVDETMATNVPGLYAAGDCTGGMLQVCKAVYEGALAGTEIVKKSRNN